MNWMKAILYGIVLFAIMFVIGSIVMFTLKITGLVMSLTMLIASIIVVWLLAKQYGVKSLNEGIQVGIVWLIMEALLEYIVIVQTFNNGNAGALYSWSVLLGYALIVIIPAYVGQTAKK